MLVLRYEAMLRNPIDAVKTIASFLEIELPDSSAVARIVRNTSFDAMKRAEKKGGLRVPGWPHRKLEGAESPGTEAVPSKCHIRRGGGGKWRKYLTEECAREFSVRYTKHIGGSIDDIAAESSDTSDEKGS